MVLPLQDKLEDWKKSAIQLDKDHAKEYKKLRSDIKKKSEAVQRAHKKQKKSKSGNEQAQVLMNHIFKIKILYVQTCLEISFDE